MVKSQESTVHEGMSTPWGKAQYADQIIDGIGTVGTAGHGGIKLRADRNKLIPEYMRRAGGWYEEDCDWCIPFVVFEAEILAAGDAHATRNILAGEHKSTLKGWHPLSFEKFFGVVLAPGESHVKDELTRLAALQAGGLTITLKTDGDGMYGFEDRLLWSAASRLLRKCWFNDADLAYLRGLGTGNTLTLPAVA